MEITRFCKLSHLWFPSWTINLRLPAESVRFSLAKRRYCLLISSSWVKLSCTWRWKAYQKEQQQNNPLNFGPYNHYLWLDFYLFIYFACLSKRKYYPGFYILFKSSVKLEKKMCFTYIKVVLKFATWSIFFPMPKYLYRQQFSWAIRNYLLCSTWNHCAIPTIVKQNFLKIQVHIDI